MPILGTEHIRTDAGTQTRVSLDQATVDEYAEEMKSGSVFPNVTVFLVDQDYILADGFHRFAAAQAIGLKEIPIDLHTGSRSDALQFALSANAVHGLKRTNADKRKAAELALKEWPKKSDRELADIAAVGDDLVKSIRDQLSENDSSLNPPTRIGKDGKERRMPGPKSAPPPAGKPTPPPAARQSKPGAKPKPAPAPRGPTDETGLEIPETLLPIWKLREDVQELMTYVSAMRGKLKAQADAGHKLLSGPDAQPIAFDMDNAFAKLKAIKPYAVCPTCLGKSPDRCGMCHGTGLVSQFFWSQCVTAEAKEMRAKFVESLKEKHVSA